MNLILIDDDPDEAYILRQALKRIETDYELSYFSDSEAFLSGLGHLKNTDSLILLDLNMPKINGFEVLEKIKNSDELANIPVVMYSNSNSPQDIELSYKTGANSYVRKPQGLTETVEFVATLINYWKRINKT